MHTLYVLLAGEPVVNVAQRRGGFDALITASLAEVPGISVRTVDARTLSALPALHAVQGLVITGSPASVTDRAGWMLRVEEYVRRAVASGIPTFGICFGFQLMAEALGGKVGKNPRGREIGTVEVEVVGAEHDLFCCEGPFLANTTHEDSVLTLPGAARLLARTAREPHAAASFGPRAWGVQFHPEFDGDVMRGYIEAREAALEAEGLPVADLLRLACDTPASRAILERFGRIVAER
jgi:GMP synthase (glutamine-hydrolysing)